MLNWWILLAQATRPASPPMSPWEAFFKNPLVPMLLIFGGMMWWMARAKKKERQRFEEMLNNLKRNDRVQTIGGVLGTVVETRGDEVIVKVDETNNVKMRFVRGAIKEVIREGTGGG